MPAAQPRYLTLAGQQEERTHGRRPGCWRQGCKQALVDVVCGAGWVLLLSALAHLVKRNRVERAEDELLRWVDGGACPFLLQESLKLGHVWFLELWQQHAAPGWLHEQRLQLGWSASRLERRRRCRHRGALLLLLLLLHCGQALPGHIAEGRGSLRVRPSAAGQRSILAGILAAHARQGAG